MDLALQCLDPGWCGPVVFIDQALDQGVVQGFDVAILLGPTRFRVKDAIVAQLLIAGIEPALDRCGSRLVNPDMNDQAPPEVEGGLGSRPVIEPSRDRTAQESTETCGPPDRIPACQAIPPSDPLPLRAIILSGHVSAIGPFGVVRAKNATSNKHG